MVQGKIKRVNVEQLDNRDQVWCRLRSDAGVTRSYYIYLDVGTTATLAQLQLLRDALKNDLRTRLYYVPTGSTRRIYDVQVFS